MARTNLQKHGTSETVPSTHKAGLKPEKKRKQRRRKRVKSDIRRLQKSTQLLNSKASFRREVRAVLDEISPELRITSSAMEAIQEASEAALTEALMSANAIATKCAGRAGPLSKDFITAVRIGHPHLMARK